MIKHLSIFVLVLCVYASMAFGQDTTATLTTPPNTDSTEEKKAIFTYALIPTFGATFQNISKSDEETLTVQWLAGLQGRMNWEGRVFGLTSSLFMQYGQLHTEHEEPVKTQDNLIFSLTPSMYVLPSLGFRLFLENTAETQMKQGYMDTIVTRFADPLFLYHALFFGQKLSNTAEDGTGEISLTYGLGYALQQTYTQDFQTVETREQLKRDPSSPISNVDIQLGISGIVDFAARKQIGDLFQLNASVKTVILGKEDTYKDITKARVGSLALASISYGVFNLEYTMRLLYDSNFSVRRQLDQSLVAGVRVEL